MPGSRRYPLIHKLAAVFTARISSVQDAATALDVDARTVAAWVETISLPSESDPAAHAMYKGLRDHLLARAAVLTAKGETKGLVQVMTAGGIAGRQVAYTRPSMGTEEEPIGDPLPSRRRQVLDAETPDYWTMPAHRSADPAARDAPEYQAALRLHDYIRASRRCLIDRIDAEDADDADERVDDPSDPIVPDAIGDAGIYLMLRHAADTSADSGQFVNSWDFPGIGAVSTDGMSDDEYRAFIRKVVELAQAEADAWWPLRCAALEEYDAARAAPQPVHVHPEASNSADAATPLPTARVAPPEAIERIPMVIDVGGRDGGNDGPWYDESGERVRPRW